MFGDSPDLAKPLPFRYSDRRQPRSAWRMVALAAAGLITLVVLFDGQTGRSDDIQVRACLEPVYAGMFGTVHALERCLENRPKLFGARDAQWLHYVKHLENSCPGGLYFHNYGSGTGLVAGVVFGRIAGSQAAGYTHTA